MMSGISPHLKEIDLNSDDTSYEEDYEDDASKHVAPEIEFAHNVFAGAETVKLWYIVVVKRPRQLNLLKGEPKIQNITTLLNSKTLKFDLQPEIYGMTDEEEKDRGMTRGHANNHLDEEEDEKHGMTDLETEDEDYGMIDLETDDEKMCDCANNQRWWIILVICFVIIAAVITIVGTKLLNCWPRNSPNWMSKCFPKWLQKIVKTDASEMQADRLRKGANNIPADKLELEGNKEDSVFLPNAEPTGAKTALFDEQCKGKIYIQFVLKD
uniref:Uncharacterized protein n=1 Tax=Panagrolaimus sp. JU765 TaxID=591449 RepID=A0AC34QJ33_9BILA